VKRFVIIKETSDNPHYFKTIALGLFWECVNTVAEARKFPTRAGAVKVMHRSDKHHEGWRVVPVEVAA
jgi:hypothetical protein